MVGKNTGRDEYDTLHEKYISYRLSAPKFRFDGIVTTYSSKPRFGIKQSHPNLLEVDLATLFLNAMLSDDPGFGHFLLLRRQEFGAFWTIREEEPGERGCQDGRNPFNQEQQSPVGEFGVPARYTVRKRASKHARKRRRRKEDTTSKAMF